VKLHVFAPLVLTFLPGIIGSPSLIAAQSARPVPVGVRELEQGRGTVAGSSIPASVQHQTIDPQKLKHDADELAALAGSVPSEVDQTNKGLLPRDLNDKLKRIEKLAKHLRSQLAP
jgi:hypothetical protein